MLGFRATAFAAFALEAAGIVGLLVDISGLCSISSVHKKARLVPATGE